MRAKSARLRERFVERLNEETLRDFIKAPGVSLILFGSNIGRPTLQQASEFAELWAERSVEARFGYLDALMCEAATKVYNIRVLPTILLVRDGTVIQTMRGYNSRAKLRLAAQTKISAGLAA